MVHGRSLREWQEKPAEQIIKAIKRKPLTKCGTYYFKINKVKCNEDTNHLYITGIPFRRNKNGEIIEYETITIYIPIEYTNDETIVCFRELCAALDLNSDGEIKASEFKGKIVEVDLDIVDYVDDKTGEVTKRFFNPDRFGKLQEQ